tara:strand:- start:1957 stop:3501 length:1545 start_codon:yes stop_codon:yes gene_type:complete
MDKVDALTTDFMSKFLSKRSCVDTHNQCSFKKPYSEMEYHYDNPGTGNEYTETEINQKNQQYENMCKLSNTKVSRCCDKNNKIYSMGLEDDKTFKVKEIYKNGKHLGYKFCDTTKAECDETFRDTVPNDACKILSKKNIKKFRFNKPDSVDLHDKIVTSLVPDCPAPCSNENYVPFLNNPMNVKSDKVEEYQLIKAIEKDDKDYVEKYYSNKSPREINKVLTQGYPGNTVLHEVVAFKARNCTNFIINSDNLELDSKNKDGNTPIHMAALQGNSTLVFRLIQLGSRVDITNNVGDNVLHSAVRSNNTATVTVVLSQNGSVMTQNILGETALHTAVMSPNKNLEIIRLLVNMGSDLLTVNNNNHTLIKSLELFDNTKENAEIRTFLLNKIYMSNKNNYHKIIKKHPELSIVQAVNKDTGKKESLKKYDNLDEIEIQYPDTSVSNKMLYSKKEKLPRKINIKEGFTSNNRKKRSSSNNNKLVEREKADCVSFIYKISSVFIILIAILVILKLLKKI